MSRPILSIIFQRGADLIEQRAHLRRGALFLPEPDPLPEPFAEITLHVESPSGTSCELAGQVLQILPGRGVAIAFTDLARAAETLAPLFADADAVPDPLAGATWVFWGRPEPLSNDAAAVAPEPAPANETASERDADADSAALTGGDIDEAPELTKDDEAARLHEMLKDMPTHEKVQLALHGDRTARLLLLRDTNKSFQAFVLQNKRITLDEVRYVAGYRQAIADVLTTIAQNRDWSQNAGIVGTLIRNPKTPTPIAVKLLDKLSLGEVRRLAKSPDVPRPIQIAARKRVGES